MCIWNENGRYPGNKLDVTQKPEFLYHYTSVEVFDKIWKGKQLKFGPTANVNDLQELIKRIEFSPEQGIALYAFRNIVNRYKQISFTMDFDTYIKGCMSSMMWAHYGDMKKGVCIEFEYDKLNFSDDMLHGRVEYAETVHNMIALTDDITTIKKLREYIIQNKRVLFFTKDNSWAPENEFRVISDENDWLDVSNAVSSVYLTENDSINCRIAEKIVGGEIPVKFLDYHPSKLGLLPITKYTKSSREQNIRAAAKEGNIIPMLDDYFKKEFEKIKDDEETDLRRDEIRLE